MPAHSRRHAADIHQIARRSKAASQHVLGKIVNAALLTAAFSIKLRRVISFFSGSSFSRSCAPPLDNSALCPVARHFATTNFAAEIVSALLASHFLLDRRVPDSAWSLLRYLPGVNRLHERCSVAVGFLCQLLPTRARPDKQGRA